VIYSSQGPRHAFAALESELFSIFQQSLRDFAGFATINSILTRTNARKIYDIFDACGIRDDGDVGRGLAV
jgi:hypothetical protein